MNYIRLDGAVLALEDALQRVRSVDAIVFDCDGTLVDVSDSQYLTTKVVACIIFEKFYGIKIVPGKEFDEAIHILKMLGGFNNVRDITAIIIETLLSESSSTIDLKADLGKISLEEYVARVSEGESSPPFVKSALNWLIKEGLKKLGEYTSKAYIISLINDKARKLGNFEELNAFRRHLGSLRSYGSGIFASLFSETYFGSEGIKRIYGVEPKYIDGPGLIKKDKIIVSEETLRLLESRVPKKLAILTGRGRLITEMSLSPILKYFDIEKSVFTWDRKDRVEKPDPSVLMECYRKLNARSVLYVGDGGEDIFLVKNAVKRGLETYFAGVLTNKFSRELFTKLGAEIIAEDVNGLTAVFEK